MQIKKGSSNDTHTCKQSQSQPVYEQTHRDSHFHTHTYSHALNSLSKRDDSSSAERPGSSDSIDARERAFCLTRLSISVKGEESNRVECCNQYQPRHGWNVPKERERERERERQQVLTERQTPSLTHTHSPHSITCRRLHKTPSHQPANGVVGCCQDSEFASHGVDQKSVPL